MVIDSVYGHRWMFYERSIAFNDDPFNDDLFNGNPFNGDSCEGVAADGCLGIGRGRFLPSYEILLEFVSLVEKKPKNALV